MWRAELGREDRIKVTLLYSALELLAQEHIPCRLSIILLVTYLYSTEYPSRVSEIVQLGT